jgi:polysaccharide biosynthesis protein PelF
MGVLEAMANGVPVVATDVGGVRDALGGGAGLLVRAGDVDALHKAIGKVLYNYKIQAEMAAAGRSRAIALFDVKKIITSLNQLYLELGASPNEHL